MATTLPIKKTESILDELQQMHDRIEQRAYEIFDGNGHYFGKDLENWLKAENELVWKPSIELKEKDKKFSLQIEVPGIDPKDIDIEVTPQEVLVKGKTRTEHTFASLFQSVQFPKKINPDKVKAEFKGGTLHLTADVAKEDAPKEAAPKKAARKAK